ncbi:hypothetical protein F4780DRAFT_256083 [Xylariomycetidae sp. FL0641]|nr:hypothetical protein F4780DRAFT_256083 [Xylariomycetidae sp. FL0641]
MKTPARQLSLSPGLFSVVSRKSVTAELPEKGFLHASQPVSKVLTPGRRRRLFSRTDGRCVRDTGALRSLSLRTKAGRTGLTMEVRCFRRSAHAVHAVSPSGSCVGRVTVSSRQSEFGTLIKSVGNAILQSSSIQRSPSRLQREGRNRAGHDRFTTHSGTDQPLACCVIKVFTTRHQTTCWPAYRISVL